MLRFDRILLFSIYINFVLLEHFMEVYTWFIVLHIYFFFSSCMQQMLEYKQRGLKI